MFVLHLHALEGCQGAPVSHETVAILLLVNAGLWFCSAYALCLVIYKHRPIFSHYVFGRVLCVLRVFGNRAWMPGRCRQGAMLVSVTLPVEHKPLVFYSRPTVVSQCWSTFWPEATLVYPTSAKSWKPVGNQFETKWAWWLTSAENIPVVRNMSTVRKDEFPIKIILKRQKFPTKRCTGMHI